METKTTTNQSIQENINLVKRTYDFYFRGDLEGLLGCYTDDIDWRVYGPSSIPTTGLHLGKDQLVEFFKKVDDLLESEKFEINQYVAQGDTVVALGEYTWRSKVTGKIIDAHFAHIIDICEGKICKFREFTDTAAAVEGMNG